MHLTLAEVAEISQERAAAMIAQLRSSDTAEVSFLRRSAMALLSSFLTVRSTNPREDLSIGQRCTVVLSVLLQAHLPTLIVDQPEDHLDNSFVTNTLVGTLRSRLPNDQMIFVSHNANIPVLGEADRVVLMGF